MTAREKYLLWMENALKDDLHKELALMNDAEIEEAFYRDLSFGTGGLRGIIGAGTNRMNVYTVAKASQGLANYLAGRFEEPSVVIGYGSRVKSGLFARTAAAVFAANGIEVHIWPELTPVPTVSFAVRHLYASAGVMITASHNPARYNGYKVYGTDGCQITTKAAADILKRIKMIEIFSDVKEADYDAAVKDGRIQYISDDVMTAYVQAVKAQSVLFGESIDKNMTIVYSPLNGTGLLPVIRVLRECGFTDVFIVPEQEKPDGNFPTCPYPNPEVKEALALGLEYAKKKNADLMLATDPDCDRVGIAVKGEKGEPMLLTGNEVGMLLLDYICMQRVKHGKMPKDPVLVKTIVTIDMAERIARHYGVNTINVLTGFKFIGEQIGLLEEKGETGRYIFGFEESYGYLSGSYVRDKDGVNGVFLICEMFAYYRTRGKSLASRLNELYAEYGYYHNTLHSYEFDGPAGFARMREIMTALRGDVEAFGGRKIVETLDYISGVNGLPKSDVLRFMLEGNCSVVARPSGTEPKLKVYLSIGAKDRAQAENFEEAIVKDLERMIR